MDPVNFVRSPKLENYSGGPFHGYGSIAGSPKSQGLVDAGSLVSFTSRVKFQQKEDVLNSTLLAQLAADKQYNRNSQTEDWYTFYTHVMSKVGWVLQGLKFDKYSSKENGFKISQVVLEIVSALIGDDKELMNVVKKTLDGLAKSSTGVTLYSSKSASPNGANFQILPCTADKSNQVNVGFLGSYFFASKVDSDYFFFTYATENIELFKSSQLFTLQHVLQT